MTHVGALNSTDPVLRLNDFFFRTIKPKHSNVVRYFEVTHHFIFMEHCPNGCLETYLKHEMKLPVREWAIQLSTALVYLHGLGWAHNQLFPCNILVSKDSKQFKVCAFDDASPLNVTFTSSSYRSAPELWITQSQTFADQVTDSEGQQSDVTVLVWSLGSYKMAERRYPTTTRNERGVVSGDHVPSHRKLFDDDRLELADFMRSCWFHYKSRSTSRVMLERLFSGADR